MKLTRSEIGKRNIKLAGKWLQRLISGQEQVDAMPDNAIVIGLPHDDPELLEANLELAVKIARDGTWGEEDRRPIVLLPE